MGLLIIKGLLRVKQFWPEGRSDADTATIEIVVAGKNPFVFIDKAGHQHPTRALDNAEVVGKFGSRPAIKQAKNSPTRKLTIRLQGIDAPELHYQPQVQGSGGKGINHKFRQSLGETSADALHNFVASFGQADLPCEVVTAVDKPGDVFDVFGRVVGNIVLHRGAARIDVNQWLLREGWAMPGLYNSMSNEEITAVLADYNAAKTGKRGLFSKKIISALLARFDPKRVERKGPSSFKPFSDSGSVNFPKFFRRQAEQYIKRAIGQNIPANLRAYLATKPDDIAIRTADFLKLKGPRIGNAAKKSFRQLASFLGGDRYPMGPELVYFENDTKLVKAGTKTPITSF